MLNDLAYLFFPVHCSACDNPLHKNERLICSSCRHKLPLTNFHYSNAEILEKVFYGRVLIANITALFVFEKQGLVQNLIHNLKYRNQEKISTELGKWLGHELSQITAYQEIDAVIPVPLHKLRLKERGYNQVAEFGREISLKLNAQYVENVLKKNIHTAKQSKRKQDNRWENIARSFSLENESSLQNKHILLVDDIITTGATLEACANTLSKIPGIKISIAAMAFTQ